MSSGDSFWDLRSTLRIWFASAGGHQYQAKRRNEKQYDLRSRSYRIGGRDGGEIEEIKRLDGWKEGNTNL